MNKDKAVEMMKERYDGIRIIKMILNGHLSSTNIALKVYGKEKVESKKQLVHWYLKVLTK